MVVFCGTEPSNTCKYNIFFTLIPEHGSLALFCQTRMGWMQRTRLPVESETEGFWATVNATHSPFSHISEWRGFGESNATHSPFSHTVSGGVLGSQCSAASLPATDPLITISKLVKCNSFIQNKDNVGNLLSSLKVVDPICRYPYTSWNYARMKTFHPWKVYYYKAKKKNCYVALTRPKFENWVGRSGGFFIFIFLRTVREVSFPIFFF